MEFLSPAMAASKRLRRFLTITRDAVAEPLADVALACFAIKQAWDDQAMSAVMAAWPKNPDNTFEGVEIQMGDLVQLDALLVAVQALVAANAVVLSKLQGVK